MNALPLKAALTLAIFLLMAQACGTPGAETPTEAPPTVQIPTALPPTDTPTAVLHTVIPATLPKESVGVAADQDSSSRASAKSAGGGDRFTKGEYERPFNSFTMDTYFPELDLIQYGVRQDDTWIYASIVLRSHDVNGALSGQYALEIDNDIDGRGEWLILVVSAPTAAEWSVENVQVWQDTNNDVGGNKPVIADNVPEFGDGYDFKVFDGGVGSDADAAWARISPENPNEIQLAVKAALVDDDGKYLAGVWAGRTLNPAMFDFNDKMTHEQAGAAIKSYTYYPIKALAELDRACRISVGKPVMVPGDNLGVCQTYAPKDRSSPASSPEAGGCSKTCPSGWGFNANCECELLPPP